MDGVMVDAASIRIVIVIAPSMTPMARAIRIPSAILVRGGQKGSQIVPVEVRVRRDTVEFRTDEHPKATTVEALASLCASLCMRYASCRSFSAAPALRECVLKRYEYVANEEWELATDDAEAVAYDIGNC